MIQKIENIENLSKYKIFMAAAEYKSISKAAALLYISQPAVSIAIKKLEENLKTTLFIRKSKGVELTENGKKLLHILEVNEMDVLIEFAKMGIGVSCVVKQFVEHELDTGSLMEIKLSNPIQAREIGFLYNKIQPLNENILRFIEGKSNSN